MVRSVQPADMQSLLSLAESLDLFTSAEIEEIKERLCHYLSGNTECIWLAFEENGLEGAVYCAPEPMTKGTWNALMLLVREDAQGRGRGSELMQAVEKQLKTQKARLLIVETSGTEGFEQAQRFYGKNGFMKVAQIPDFYDSGDDKIVFAKRLC
ncbi:MAG: hypothetical protein DESF_01364 [Desulfovibrio sp.]